MRYFIAGGGCYGSYYVRQLDRARARGLLKVDEIIVVDRNPHCAVAPSLSEVAGARLEVADWLDFGEELYRNRNLWGDDMWVPTPLGPHIIFHWIKEKAKAVAFAGPLPQLPYAQVISSGSLVLSHAPGLCPVNCVEPILCPLTKSQRDWEMADTVREHIAATRGATGIEAVGLFVCQHHAHGVGTIPLQQLFSEWERLKRCFHSGARIAVATVSSCHGIVDAFELP